MTKQDEKARLHRRLQDRAVEVASKSRWDEAVDVNRQILELGEDADAFNRLGKALFELGQLSEAREAYQNTLRLNPSNGIARKNVERLESLLARSGQHAVADRSSRELVDLRLFITEIGKTALSTLVDVPRTPAVDAIVTGERVDLRLEGRNVMLYDVDGNYIGRIEPKLAQRLSELLASGNRYAAAVAQTNNHSLRILIRETYQDPSQRGRVSFPGKFGEGLARVTVPGGYDEYAEDLLEEEETVEETEEIEEESFGNEEEELGLDEIEQDIGEDDEMNEE